MKITYDTRKDLPCAALRDLFAAVGWSDGRDTPEEMLTNFNKPFLHSTMVVSAWNEGQLVGCVRVLSDQMFRSVLYDLAVLPACQGRGIGTELVRRCREAFPNSQWLVGTEGAEGFYLKLGFTPAPDTFLHIPCKCFS